MQSLEETLEMVQKETSKKEKIKSLLQRKLARIEQEIKSTSEVLIRNDLTRQFKRTRQLKSLKNRRTSKISRMTDNPLILLTHTLEPEHAITEVIDESSENSIEFSSLESIPKSPNTRNEVSRRLGLLADLENYRPTQRTRNAINEAHLYTGDILDTITTARNLPPEIISLDDLNQLETLKSAEIFLQELEGGSESRLFSDLDANIASRRTEELNMRVQNYRDRYETQTKKSKSRFLREQERKKKRLRRRKGARDLFYGRERAPEDVHFTKRILYNLAGMEQDVKILDPRDRNLILERIIDPIHSAVFGQVEHSNGEIKEPEKSVEEVEKSDRWQLRKSLMFAGPPVGPLGIGKEAMERLEEVRIDQAFEEIHMNFRDRRRAEGTSSEPGEVSFRDQSIQNGSHTPE